MYTHTLYMTGLRQKAQQSCKHSTNSLIRMNLLAGNIYIYYGSLWCLKTGCLVVGCMIWSLSWSVTGTRT